MKNIAELIFLDQLEVMKEVLDLGAYRLGKDSKEYSYFKRKVMDLFYNHLRDLFKRLAEEGLIERCSCNGNVRHGYTQCPECHGAGYVNAGDSKGSMKVQNAKSRKH
jgi:hypothetical protein